MRSALLALALSTANSISAPRTKTALQLRGGGLDDLDVVQVGAAGQDVSPMERAGCYAPGGRYPLPSTVLMTCIPAKVAGCSDVWLASPYREAIALSPEAQHHAVELTRTMACDVEFWNTFDPSIIETENRDEKLQAYRMVRDNLMERIKERFPVHAVSDT